MSAGQAQPDVMPFLRFRLDEVVCLEPGLTPSTVIPAGTPFTLRLDFGFDGLFAPLLIGQTFNVVHHLTEIETGNTSVITGGSFTVPAPPASAHITVTSPPITLTVPAGFASGTNRILTHCHAVNAAIRPIVAAFHDGLVVMIT